MTVCIWRQRDCGSVAEENKLPTFYKRYVDDTLSAMSDLTAASEFLTTLNESHPSINFTMELEENGKLPLFGMNVIRNGCRLYTTVYRKPTDTGLLLHYHSHVDARYKRFDHCLIKNLKVS